MKAECDRIVREIMGDASTVVRPTYVVGPGDHTDRFTYWVDRINRGGYAGMVAIAARGASGQSPALAFT